MAAALENEIIGRGFDPRDFVLMSYGGAGPFHAAGYAASLGVDTIVVPGEAASVWSAFGISQADIRYQYESSVVLIEPFDPARSARLRRARSARPRAALGRARGRRRLRVPPLRPHALPVAAPRARDALPRRRDRRRPPRRGQSASSSSCTPNATARSRCCPGAVEIVSIRLEPAIAMGSANLDRLDVAEGEEFRKGSREVYFERGAGAVDAAVFNGDAMPLGEVVEGPAVIDLAITGIVLPPGTRCERRQTGDFVITLGRAEGGTMHRDRRPSARNAARRAFWDGVDHAFNPTGPVKVPEASRSTPRPRPRSTRSPTRSSATASGTPTPSTCARSRTSPSPRSRSRSATSSPASSPRTPSSSTSAPACSTCRGCST